MINHSADTTPWPASTEPVLDRPPVAERPRYNPYPKPQRPQRWQQDRQRPADTSRHLDFAAASGATDTASRDSTTVPSPRSPEWNDDWQSWVYWDDDRRQWLRFDSETGEWEPMR